MGATHLDVVERLFDGFFFRKDFAVGVNKVSLGAHEVEAVCYVRPARNRGEAADAQDGMVDEVVFAWFGVGRGGEVDSVLLAHLLDFVVRADEADGVGVEVCASLIEKSWREGRGVGATDLLDTSSSPLLNRDLDLRRRRPA